MKNRKNERISSSKYLFAALSAILIFLLWKFIVVSIQMINSQSHISSLKTELEGLQQKQNRLHEMEQFFKSDFFAEREARLKYGLQKKDEKAVIIKHEKQSADTAVQHRDAQSEGVQHQTLPVRAYWLKYFFGTE